MYRSPAVRGNTAVLKKITWDSTAKYNAAERRQLRDVRPPAAFLCPCDERVSAVPFVSRDYEIQYQLELSSTISPTYESPPLCNNTPVSLSPCCSSRNINVQKNRQPQINITQARDGTDYLTRTARQRAATYSTFTFAATAVHSTTI